MTYVQTALGAILAALENMVYQVKLVLMAPQAPKEHLERGVRLDRQGNVVVMAQEAHRYVEVATIEYERLLVLSSNSHDRILLFT